MADLKHYQDKDGHVFSMTEEHAKKLGYTLADNQPKPAANAEAETAQPAEGAADAQAPDRAVPERGASGESVVVHQPAARGAARPR